MLLKIAEAVKGSWQSFFEGIWVWACKNVLLCVWV